MWQRSEQIPGRTFSHRHPTRPRAAKITDATVLTNALMRCAPTTPLPTAAQETASQRTQNDPSGIRSPAIPTGPTQRQGGRAELNGIVCHVIAVTRRQARNR